MQDVTDSILFTNLSAKVSSGDIVFSELNFSIMKAKLYGHILSVSSYNAPRLHWHTSCTKTNIINARVNEVENKIKTIIGANQGGDSHYSNVGAEVSGDEDTGCILWLSSSKRML